MPRLLFFGDIMGKPGRRALAQILPSLRQEHEPDIVIANVENLAHGKGVTLKTVRELVDAGVDVFTSGNHVFDKDDQSTECFHQFPQLIRPANYVALAAPKNGESSAESIHMAVDAEQIRHVPGASYYRITKKGQSYLVINLGGQVFFEKQFDGIINNPFFALDELLSQQQQKGDIIVVDFHAEATSEKAAMGWYADGRIAAMLGTHTHVATADAKILPGGTAYVTDVGMTGAMHSVIGVKIENALTAFLEKGKFKMEVAEDGPIQLNAVLVETDGVKVLSIKRIYQELK